MITTKSLPGPYHKMLSKKNRLIFILLLLVSSCNIYIFFNRDEYSYVKQSTYSELYPLTGNPSVCDLRTINDSSIRIITDNPSAKKTDWQIITDTLAPITKNASSPEFVLLKGVHNYTIFTKEFPDTIRIKAEYVAKDSITENDKARKPGITIYKAELPVLNATEVLERWKDNEVPVSAAEKDSIQKILNDSIGIRTNDITVDKIKKMGAYLGTRLLGGGGLPPKSVRVLSIFGQYRAVCRGQKIWCGNYALVFNLFARAANIKSRNISISRAYGGAKGNLHVFNEYYIPEQRSWAAIDLMFNNIMYTDASGKLLNAVEVKNANPADNSIQVLQAAAKDYLVTKPFSTLETDFFEFFGRDKNLVYYNSVYQSNSNSFQQKMSRYFTQRSSTEIYSDSIIYNNLKFHVKQLLLLLEMILLLWFLGLLILGRFYSKK